MKRYFFGSHLRIHNIIGLYPLTVVPPYCRHRVAVFPPSLPVATSRFRRSFSPTHPELRETHIQSCCAELQGET
ncbi:hypothetical protein Q3G72_016284 [Acer saccharum]|nr:hypothetical protein Q3G72_016284 [Acer saccharum]